MTKKLLFGVFAIALLGAAPACAADMIVKAPLYKTPLYKAPSPTFNWAGWYVGGNAGYVNSQNELTTAVSPTPDASLGAPPGVSEGLAALSGGTVSTGNGGGFIAGGQIGYNWQFFGGLVAGFEEDLQGIAASGGSGATTTTAVVVGVPVTSTRAATLDTKYLATVRGRLGFLVTPTWLVYCTGGLAYGGFSATTSLSQVGATNGFVGIGAGTLSDTRAGWTLGGGLEWMFAQNWSAKLEYLHYDIGTVDIASTGAANRTPPIYQQALTSAQLNGNLFRAGANLHF